MKKYILILAAVSALVSCKSLKEEWDPVFTFGGNEPGWDLPVTRAAILEKAGIEQFTTIADLKALYAGKPLIVSGNVWIEGQITSSDESGNIYSEMYLQDKTGGIDLKMGMGSLHNEYKLGQWVYVKCDGLTLGSYEGQPQLGFQADETITNEYQTSYIGLRSLVEEHIFRGFEDIPLAPTVVTAAQIKAAVTKGYTGDIWGKLITINNLTYGSTKGFKQIYALFYPNPNLPHKSSNPENRIFLSVPQKDTDLIDGFDYSWGITTWAANKEDYINYIKSGVWDMAQVNSGSAFTASYITKTPYDILTGTTYEERLSNFGMDAFITYKEIMIKYATANYVSHYFNVDGQDVQVRTSGYAKFAGQPVPADIVDGAPVSITGIASLYTGSTPPGVQISLIDEPSISIVLEPNE